MHHLHIQIALIASEKKETLSSCWLTWNYPLNTLQFLILSVVPSLSSPRFCCYYYCGHCPLGLVDPIPPSSKFSPFVIRIISLPHRTCTRYLTQSFLLRLWAVGHSFLNQFFSLKFDMINCISLAQFWSAYAWSRSTAAPSFRSGMGNLFKLWAAWDMAQHQASYTTKKQLEVISIIHAIQKMLCHSLPTLFLVKPLKNIFLVHVNTLSCS